MLNKDEYNQDEYNDYYAKETQGAEISGGKNSGGDGKKIVFVILLALLIIALAYFGWKSMSGSEPTKTKIEKSDVTTPNRVDVPKDKDKDKDEVVKEEKEPQTTEEKNITKEVQNIASNESGTKMSSEDIANIVQMVMQKMKKEKSKEVKTKPTEDSPDQLQDSKLMQSLSDLEVDSISSELDNIDAIPEKDKSKKASSDNSPNTYNKVVLDNKVEKSSDELSKLSDEISNVINAEESETKDNTNYTQEIKKEVKTRTKEMRYITVKKGDTLGKIAKRVYGNVMDYKKIYKANPDILRRADRIYIGQRLRVPE